MTKLCECGCGEAAPLAIKTSARFGWVQGQSVRFMRGHSARRQFCKLPVAERLRSASIELSCGCVLWLRATGSHGYGQMSVEGKLRTTHTLAWELANGVPVPAGLFVCHTCDIRSCICAEHLFLGTSQDNVDDMVRKGRARNRSFPGELHYAAKLTEAQALGVLTSVESAAVVAVKLGVLPAAVRSIRAGRTWKHLRALRAAA